MPPSQVPPSCPQPQLLLKTKILRLFSRPYHHTPGRLSFLEGSELFPALGSYHHGLQPVVTLRGRPSLASPAPAKADPGLFCPGSCPSFPSICSHLTVGHQWKICLVAVFLVGLWHLKVSGILWPLKPCVTQIDTHTVFVERMDTWMDGRMEG